MTRNLSTTCALEASQSADEQNRLAAILDEYLQGLERGEPISPEELLARNPDVADPLRGYLSGLRIFHQAAASPQEPFVESDIGRRDGHDLHGDLGDFRLVREIGRGGMGIVYEGVQVSLGRRVAIKVLPFSASIDEKQIARFKNEAHAAAQVDHPHIVPVFAIGQEHGIHYFAMQFIGGKSLSDVLAHQRSQATTGTQTARGFHSAVQASRTLDHVWDVARMGHQAAEALHAAHEIGVVHRDIKPSNLLLDEKQKVWVTDFGVARCKSSTRITETGHALGTMRYMSPEQALGNAALVDHRTDIYSLGVTLYELATLRHPFEDVPDAAMAFEFGRTGWRRPRYWNQAIPVDFENIVLKAMAEGRDERYATARELADDLERFLEGKPILARRPSWTSRMGKWARRHRRSVAAAIGMLMLALAGVVASLVVIAGERAGKELAYQEARKSQRHAEEQFRHAWEMLDHFGARVAERLANVPGAEGVRKELLSETLRYYREFAQESEDEPALHADLALTYSKIGYLSDQLGSIRDAEVAYQDALRILERLVHDRLSVSEHARGLALCCNNLGQVLEKRGSVDASRRHLERALKIQEQLVARSPGSNLYLADLARTQSNLGLLLSRLGEKREAADRYREAIRIQESILRAAPQDAANMNQLAASYNNLSSLYLDSRPEVARQWVEMALSLQLKLVREHPRERNYQSDLALSYNNLGAILSRRTNWHDAESCFQDAITIQKRLKAAAPLVTAYRRDLAVSYNNLGMAQNSADKVKGAADSFEQALALQRDLVAGHPHDLSLLSGLGGIYNNLGMVHQHAGRWAEAAKHFEQAIAAQRAAHERAPHVAHFRESLSKHHYNHAAVLRKLDRLDVALETTLLRRLLWQDDAHRLLRVAEELATICKELEPGELRNRYMDEMRNTLEAARDAGLEEMPDESTHPFDVWSDARVTAALRINK
jgi:tetratricopeptide (TPR) repeat protein/tRNA A-37 threonylcarbamoyl transferase component Bud32